VTVCEDLVQLSGAVVCLCAALWMHLFYTLAVDGRIVSFGTIRSVQSTPTSKIIISVAGKKKPPVPREWDLNLYVWSCLSNLQQPS